MGSAHGDERVGRYLSGTPFQPGSEPGALGTELANTDVNTELDGYGDYGIPASGTFLKRFAYDSLNRLLSADGAQEAVRWSPTGGIDLTKPWSPWTMEPDTPEEYTETYGWDLNGNLTSLSHANATTSFTRNFAMVAGTNRLDEVSYNSGTTISGYAHDAAGNVVQEDSSRHFVWDHANRLREFRSQATPTSSRRSRYPLPAARCPLPAPTCATG